MQVARGVRQMGYNPYIGGVAHLARNAGGYYRQARAAYQAGRQAASTARNAYNSVRRFGGRRYQPDKNLTMTDIKEIGTGAARSGAVMYRSRNIKKKSKKQKIVAKKRKVFKKRVKNIINKTLGGYLHKYKTHSYGNLTIAQNTCQKYLAIPFLFHDQLYEMWHDIYERTAKTGITEGENMHSFFDLYVKKMRYRQNITCLATITENYPMILDIYYFTAKKKLNSGEYATIQALVEANHQGKSSRLTPDTIVTATYATDWALTPFLNYDFTHEFFKIYKMESHIMTAGQTIQLNDTIKINKWWKPQKGRLNGATEIYSYPDFTQGVILVGKCVNGANAGANTNVFYHTGHFDVTYTGKALPTENTFNILAA